MEEKEGPDEDLIPCKICGRTFFQAVIKKHITICQTHTTKRRKIFDSSRQRAEGTDISTVKPLKPKAEPPKKSSNWRRKHEDFIATIRAAKNLTQTIKDGGPLPPPPPPSYDPDYIQCPYCQRRFSENAAERHINFCKEQAARIGNKGKLSSDSKGKTASRPQIKPPTAKKTNSPASVVSPSSRLPQPSSTKPPGSGLSSTRILSTSANKTNSSHFSPPSLNSSPQGGINMKSRTPSSPGSLKNTSVVTANRKKAYNPDSYTSKKDGRSGLEAGDCLSGVPNRRSDRIVSEQLSRFCHECGTKYPVDHAKFCCECGVRRMCI
ncbi:zinc finger C2HC domain-containing protein 1A [Erpetoichthys calabaricus]|uniref:Zinc finger C2HC domain-containing protein 1A n=1 Tax=Erpetoichthys calabaricus TaxID=27687 RepID=A0A8C4RZY2_ERPCA|nr:zinc finger C2HC domain-containing protein 1A [Erpetoichthys calabaricus]